MGHGRLHLDKNYLVPGPRFFGHNLFFYTSDLAQIEIYRETSLTTANNVFAAGSSVKAASLNNNQTQVLYALEEQENSIEKGEIFSYANANHSAGATAPTTPSSGDTWFDTTGGRTYIYYVD